MSGLGWGSVTAFGMLMIELFMSDGRAMGYGVQLHILRIYITFSRF